MKLLVSVAFLSLSVTAALAEIRSVAPEQLTFEDADTLVVASAAEPLRVQLSDIDAPESADNPKLQRDLVRTGLSATQLIDLGKAADAGLERILGEFKPYQIQVFVDKRDKYGRYPGDLVRPDGVTLSHRLVEEGFAVALPKVDESRRTLLQDAERRARQARAGLWGSHPATFAHWVEDGK